MKLTRESLKQIIKEELEEMMGDQGDPALAAAGEQLFKLMQSSGRSLAGFVTMVQAIAQGQTPTRDTNLIQQVQQILQSTPALKTGDQVNPNAVFDAIQSQVDKKNSQGPQWGPGAKKTVYETKKTK